VLGNFGTLPNNDALFGVDGIAAADGPSLWYENLVDYFTKTTLTVYVGQGM
jgi:hypothetical protein